MGCFTGGCDLTQGLTDAGRRIVDEAVDLGVLLDVSHCTPPALAEIYERVEKRAPIIATHAGAHEVNPSPYNLKD